MTRNRVSPFEDNASIYSVEKKIEDFDANYDDFIIPAGQLPGKSGDQKLDENITKKKNPIVDNVEVSILRRRRSRRSARNLRRRQQQEVGYQKPEVDVVVSDEDDDDDDDKDDLRTRIENKKGPGHWTPFLHQRRSVSENSDIHVYMYTYP